MSVTNTYPGVYVQEIPSGVRTITGVATSIAAFVGRTLRGPVDTPITINSFADFERTFGGLWQESPLSFAVHDFYMNGGGQAIIVRLVNLPDDLAIAAVHFVRDADAKISAAKTALKEARAAKKGIRDAESALREAEVAKTDAEDAVMSWPKFAHVAMYEAMNTLLLKAVSPGAWGNSLRVRIEHLDDDNKFDKQSAEGFGLRPNQMFHLTVYDGQTKATESHRNLTNVKGNTRFVDKVLENNSTLVRGTWVGEPADPEKPEVLPLPKAHAPAHSVEDIWADNSAADTAKATSSGFTGGSDGEPLESAAFIGKGMEMAKKGLYALEHADLFNLLCIPPHSSETDIETDLLTAASAYAKKRRAFMIVDPPATWKDKASAKKGIDALNITSENAAVYFPRLRKPNPLRGGQVEDFAPCGAVAGVYARTDSQRGVWKAPAGLEATLKGVPQLSVPLTDAENGELNPLGINCLRSMPAAGRVTWGARTRQGDDRLASEWKYVPVRRLALYIEESLYRGTQWVVFEPNDEPLWAQIRLNLGTFMHDLFRKGAFQGTTPREAYFVKCDHETTTQSDVDLGIVNILVGFAPLKPAEFVIISLQQMAGQIQT
jgi:phage tail sheath protein FI